MNTSRYVFPSSRYIVLLALGGAAGAFVALYLYSFLSLVLGPRPAGAVLAPAQLPAVANWMFVSVRGLAWVSGLFGAAALIGLAYLAKRVPEPSSLRFALGSALLVAAFSYPVTLASDSLLERGFHTHTSFFVVIAGCGFAGGAFVHRYSLRQSAGVA